MTNEQRIELHRYIEKMEKLDHEVRKLGDLAEKTGDLVDDTINGRSYSRICFNMARAIDAAVVATGDFDCEPKLEVHMTDPEEIIKRCDLLINAAEEFLVDVRYAISSKQFPPDGDE